MEQLESPELAENAYQNRLLALSRRFVLLGPRADWAIAWRLQTGGGAYSKMSW
jgi:hypothetical protein